MPYPSPVTFPSALLYPGVGQSGGNVVAFGDLVLNAEDEFGVYWLLEDLEGWSGSPGSTLEIQQRARGHGGTANEPFLHARTMVAKGTLTAPSAAARRDAVDRLNAAASLSPFRLVVNEAGLVRECMAQRQDDVIAKEIGLTVAEFSVQIKAKDPRKYGELVTKSTLLPSSTGGLIRPSTWPRTWTGVSNTGVISIENPGNEQAPAWLRIDGPIPAGGWTVTHLGKKQQLAFATSLALDAGGFVTVDMEKREVLAQGQSPRAGYVTSRGWFCLDPGLNSIAFSAANYSQTALLTLTTKPAWS